MAGYVAKKNSDLILIWRYRKTINIIKCKGAFMINISSVSTGIKGLDKTINYLQMGDNVVFQVQNIEDYKKFVNPYVNKALEKGRRVVYMRLDRKSVV